MIRSLSALVFTALCLCHCAWSAEDAKTATPPSATAAQKTSQSSSAQQAARDETVRRQAAQQTARKLIRDGQSLMSDDKLPEAAAKFEDALKVLPRGPATDVDYTNATRGLADSYYRIADAAYRKNDNAKAKQYAQKALEYVPSYRSAENLIVKIKMAEQQTADATAKPPPTVAPPDPDETPQFIDTKNQIKKLFREGRILYNSGQYAQAEKSYQQILVLDPYNQDAMNFLKQVYRAEEVADEHAIGMAHALYIEQVSDSWRPSVSRDIQAPQPGGDGQPIQASAARSTAILQKLNTIVIPEINFRDAVITDVVRFLSDESRRLDPDHVGINFVLQLGAEAGAAPLAPEPVPVAPEGGAPPPPPTPAISGARTITLSLHEIPLIEALKYVTSVAGLKFRVEPSAVLILPKDAPEGELITRSYPVSAGAIETLVVKPGTQGGFRIGEAAGGAAAATVTEIAPEALKQFFTDAGVPFPAGSSLAYNKRTSTIIVRNTPENMEIFERILATLNVVPSQVEIEAKFVDVAEQDLEELAFQWWIGQTSIGNVDLEGGTPGSPLNSLPPTAGPNSDIITGGLRDASASLIQANAIDALLAATGFGTLGAPQDQVASVGSVLTDPQFQVIIKALSQKGAADVLSAPKVTTISGAQAQIKVVQEFIYPSDFDPPQVVAAGGGSLGGGSVGVTPSTPSTFKTREVGVILNVTPTVGPDGYTINLTLVPEVSEFLGFINYGGPIAIAAGNNVLQTFNDIKQPLFASRTLTTSIVIWDGQTVVLGGLIRDEVRAIRDKVPFLGDIPMVGRLFRSNVTQHSKRNLLIFVTVRLIDPSGNLIHRQEITTRK